jgi:hypothetical protein
MKEAMDLLKSFGFDYLPSSQVSPQFQRFVKS